MENPRPSSPTRDQIENEKAECQKSPTTVIETETVVFEQSFPSSDEETYDDDNHTTVEEPVDEEEEQEKEKEEPSFATPNATDLKTPPPPPPPQSTEENNKEDRYSKLRRKQFDRRKYLNILPTIHEVTSYEEKTGETKSSLGVPMLSEADDILLHIQTLSAPVNSVHELKEIQEKIEDASLRAKKGNEDKALAIYKDVLGVLEKEVTRITKQMEVLGRKQSKFENTKLYIILHEEWSENALVVADVKSKMATIYEQRENYQDALECVTEAREIYQRQANFDEDHNNNGSSAREKEMSMEIMMEQIEEATESHSIRKSLHETVERIREKIIATKDETSRGFLYEDIFDKLSTVLSLELMYLGDEHPQISNTKGLLGKFYGEIKQNEKALRVMNEAVLICETSLGNLHPETGTKYQDAAKLYDRIGGDENCSKAIELYEKAITNFEKSEGNVSEKMCSCLNRVAILYIQQKSYDLAIEKLKSAIHISEENYRERSDDISTEPIQLWLNISECHGLKGNSSLASEASRNALRIQKEKRQVYDFTARKGSGDIPALISNSKIAFTLKKLGKSLAAESKFEESYSSFEEALSILRADLATAQESGKFDPTIDIPGKEDEVATVLYDLAKIKQTDNKLIEACELYKESLELCKESDKKRTVTERSNNIDCALCLAGIGSIEMIEKAYSDAFKSFNQAIYYAKQEGIPESDPITQMLWDKSRIAAENMNNVKKPKRKSAKTAVDDIVISPLEDKAKELRKTKDLANSIKTINTVIGMKRAHVEKIAVEDQNTNAKRQLAASLIFKGEVALLLGEKKDATDCINEASNLLKESGADDDDESVKQIEKFRKKVNKSDSEKMEYIQMFSGMSQIDQKVRKINKTQGNKSGKTRRLKNIGDRIRKIKRKPESTMGEF